MKLSERDKLLITILAVVLIVVCYFMFLMPPALDKVKALRNQGEDLEKQIVEAQNVIGQSDVISDQYKFLNAKILAFSENFFQKLEQERIILILDQLLAESGLQAKSISFKDPTNLSLMDFSPDKISVMQSRDDLPCLEVSLAYSGSFNELLNFLGKINEHNKKILVKDVNLVNASRHSNTSSLAGNIALEFYAVPSLIGGTNGALVWAEEEVGGISDPFSGGSLVDVFKDLGGESIAEFCDFVLTVKPITADLPTVVLGIDDDISADSFVFADNPGVENIELRLFMQDGEYLCTYKTTKESYPYSGPGVAIPFVNGDQKIVMNIFSNPRTSVEDESGVNLKLYNETDKPLFVRLINEDPLRPRVNFGELTSNIIVQ
jgi:type IV pilus assembly protein PilO